jgi:hypothetical protein
MLASMSALSRTLSAVPVVLCLAGAPAPARACGGFFCDNLDPVIQTAERILFRIGADDTVTTIVEIQYEGPPSQFGWVLPIPEALPVESIETAPAGLFDALETRLAPTFSRPAHGDTGGSSAADESSGCGCERPGVYDWFEPPPPDTSGVQVIGEAVVGPYEIEIITAEQGDNLSNWLLLNGYQIPQSAVGAMDHYIGLKMAFLGLKLRADVPAGPIDALTFTYQGQTPMIPLILTRVAAAADMEIVAYIAGPGRHVPGNYADLAFDYTTVHWTGEDTTDYDMVLREAITAAGPRVWHTEFAGLLGPKTGPLDDTPMAGVLERDDYVTRFHTFISPADMTVDPYWLRDSAAPDVDNHHVLGDGYERDPAGRKPGLALVLAPLALLALRRPRAAAGRRG